MLRGADVSHWQGTIAWDDLAGSIDFVFLKATEGTGTVDDTFEDNRSEAARTKLIRGYYHFARPASDAETQADHFCNTVGELRPGELDPVLDLEDAGGLSVSDLKQWTRDFVAKVREHYPDRGVIIYCGYYFWRDNVGAIDDYVGSPLWIPAYPRNSEVPPAPSGWEAWVEGHSPAGWSPWQTWSFWQFAQNGRLPGVSGNVDCNLFRGSRAQLRRMARLNLVTYPFADATAASLYKRNEGADGGHYPIGANGFWHGGVHLPDTRAVRAVAGGRILAYRIEKQPRAAQAVTGQGAPSYSTSFVLVHHELLTPKQAKIDFFCLYMHLLPTGLYSDAQKAAPPIPILVYKYSVATREDGKGLNVRTGQGLNTVAGVVPKGAQVQVAPADTAVRNGRTYTRVTFGGLTGYAYLTGKMEQVSGTTYRCTTSEDSPGDGALGLNVRASGSANAQVLRVLPQGTAIVFTQPDVAAPGGRLSQGWHEIVGGGWVFTRLGNTPSILATPEIKPEAYDKVVACDIPIAGDEIVGYPGPYFAQSSVIHFEVFTGDVGFMDNPKGDVGGRRTLKIPPGTALKKKAASDNPVIQANLPPGSQLQLVEQGDQHRKVECVKIVGWVPYADLGPYNESTGTYSVSSDLTLHVSLPTAAATPATVAVPARAGNPVRYVAKSGDYRRVSFTVPAGDRATLTGWAPRSALGTYASSKYTLQSTLASLRTYNPEWAFVFQENAGSNQAEMLVDVPADVRSPALCRDREGKMFQEVELAPGTNGWIAHDTPGVLKSAYDFPRWQKLEESGAYSEDGLCDAPELIAMLDKNGDRMISRDEIKAAITDRILGPRIRRLVCRHPTEWSSATKGWERLKGLPWSMSQAAYDATMKVIEALRFWEDTTEANLPDPAKVWHFHAIGFLEQLREMLEDEWEEPGEDAPTETATGGYRLLRIRLLDCRSGEALTSIRPEHVMIGAAGDTLDPGEHGIWDIVGHYHIPVSENGTPTPAAGYTAPNNLINLQIALNAMGYDCGAPSEQFGPQGTQAFKSFQKDWYDANPNEQRPASYAAAVTAQWVRRIVAAHNERFIGAVQAYLTALGYPCDAEDGDWGEETEAQFKKWQKEVVGSGSPYANFNGAQQDRRDLARRLARTAQGDLRVPVPLSRVKQGFKLGVSYADFAVCNERQGFRTSLTQAPTGFTIEWLGPQNETRWGWRLRPSGSTADRDDLAELVTQFESVVPALPEGDFAKLTGEGAAAAGFSPFFKTTQGAPEIVLFALVWCQPVFDDHPDPPAGTISQTSYIQQGAERNRHMHVVTTYFDLAGAAAYGGKGYGLWESSPPYQYRGSGHPGFDLEAVRNAPAFAVHAGTVTRYTHNAAGNYTRLTWGTGANAHTVRSLHLTSFSVENNTRVRAGQIIGLAGRTGNLGNVSEWPGHVHFDVDYGNTNYAGLRNAPDAANRVCLPHNGMPLLLPCHCQVTAAASNPANCRFSSSTFATPCWAVAELKCPHLRQNGQEDRRLQAQLRYLFERNGAPYLNPGALDNNLGPVPASLAAAGSSRRAIRAFRIAQNLGASFEMSAAATTRLDALAPITDPEG